MGLLHLAGLVLLLTGLAWSQASESHECTGGSLRVDTTSRLSNLRALFRSNSDIDAYIVPSEDAHQSEYTAECHQRRGYISGFSGSAGIAVITRDKAALWTDGRYFLQAGLQLDCNWILMRDGEPDVPTMLEWIEEEFSGRSGMKVGSDPTLVSATDWMVWKDSFEDLNIALEPVDENLVDLVWKDQPSCSDAPVEKLPMMYAGRSWKDKIEDVRKELQEKKVSEIVVTSLDEIAWLFNLRGADIPYNPVFFAYAVITMNKVYLFMQNSKLTKDLMKYLEVPCASGATTCIEVRQYKNFMDFIESHNWNRVLLPSKYSYSGGVSYAIYEKIPSEKVLMGPSPLLFLKGKKNEVEKQGMRRSHIKDAVALISFLARLEKEMMEGKKWTEMKVSEELKKYRSVQEGFKGLSFTTIAGYGSNGAIIHYKPSNATNKEIGTDSLFLLDSGGQYLDGTTDVTRTMHYGEPTEFEKEMYTRVLSGAISLAMAKFPVGTKDTRIDILARLPLFRDGRNYRHGTGHGIGAFLNVHESSSLKGTEGFYGSIEPGYYEDGKFGIRLETIVESVHYKNTSYGEFLGFDAVTLVPFEPKLIQWELLNRDQVNWLNKYNGKIRTTIGPFLERLSDGGLAKEWMVARTGFVSPTYEYSVADSSSHNLISVACLLCCTLLASLVM